jgi:hypothetical protein
MAEKNTLRVDSYRSPSSDSLERRGAKYVPVEDALSDYESRINNEAPINQKPTNSKNDEDEFMKAFGLTTQPKTTNSEIIGRVRVSPKKADLSDEEQFLEAFGIPKSPSDVKNVPTPKDDPFYHGAVPIRDMPQQGADVAFAGNALSGIPIVGPFIKSGVEKAAAATRSVLNDSPYSQELESIQDASNLASSQNPKTALAGNITGGVLGMTAAAGLAPSAIMGSGATILRQGLTAMPANALINAVDSKVRGGSNSEAAVAGGIGAAAGFAGPYITEGGRRLGKGIVGAIEPFTPKGQSDIADRYLAKIAAGGPLKVDATEYVQGSKPTFAQATANPGLATTERAIRDIRPNPFVAREAENAAARVDSFNALRGDELSLDNLIARRAAVSDPVREAAFLNKTPTDPSNVVGKIDEILASPSGQRDVVVSALNNLKKKLIITPEKVLEDGTVKPAVYQTDPEQLYGIRKAIGDMLSPMSKGTEANKQLASRELQQVMTELDTSIESGAGGFQRYLKTFSDASKPIDSEKFLQKANVFDAKGNVNLGPIDRLIRTIKDAKRANGTNQAKNIADTTVSSLENIRKDLLRAQNSSLGKSIGSNTFQNLATANAANQMGVPLAIFDTLNAKPGTAVAMYFLRKAYSAKNDAIIDEIVNKLLTPALPTSKAFLGGNALNQNKVSGVNKLIGGAVPVLTIRGNSINRLTSEKSE